MTNQPTSRATDIYYAVRARLNNGATLELAVKGAMRECGALRTARVSSAHARGAAGKYAYWGAVRYHVRFAVDGRLVNMPRERASSDRRSVRLAERDCDDLETREDRVYLGTIGCVTPALVAQALGISA